MTHFFRTFESLFDGKISIISHSKKHALIHFIDNGLLRTFVLELYNDTFWILSPLRTWRSFDRTTLGLLKAVDYILNTGIKFYES